MVERAARRPSQYRLPQWAHEFVAEEAERYGITKTQVVLRALELLRDSELEALMAEGYQDVAHEGVRVAEQSLPVAAEVLDEW